MGTWGDLHDAGRYRFYDVPATFVLLSRGASFARLPEPEEEAGVPAQLLPLLAQRLRDLGGAPETFGVCVAAPDFPLGEEDYARDPKRYRPGAFSEEVAAAIAERTRGSLPPGRYCHGSALDRRPWSDLQVSPLELQESFARDVLQGKRVLVLRGADGIPTDADLRSTLRFAATASALPVPRSSVQDLPGLAALLAELDAVLDQGTPPPFDTLLLAGLPAGVGALLALEVGCRRPTVQALDAGALTLAGPRGAARPQQAPAPLRTRSVGEASFPLPGAAAGAGAAWDPRPQLLRPRAERVDLNGPWELLIGAEDLSMAALPRGPWPESVRVPFAPQAHDGSATKISAYEVLWYRRRLRLPASWCERATGLVYLEVDACDWECKFFLDGRLIGKHQGAYDPFVLGPLDLGPSACTDGAELLVRVWDPTDAGCEFSDNPPIPCDRCCEWGWQPRGKQSLRPGFIMYSGVSGLWRQGLWLERRPPCHLAAASAAAAQPGAVAVRAAATCGQRLAAQVRLRGESAVLASAEGPCCELSVQLAGPLQPWSPESPVMYEAVLTLDGGADTVVCPFAQREVVVRDNRVLLNGQPIFMHGVLYQGYWPESLLTPPGPAPGGAALEQDLRAIKDAGFNTVRVHAVVMGALFYALCDVLGLLVWQDMPAGDSRAMPVWEGRRGEVEDELQQAVAMGSGSLSTGALDEIQRSPESDAAFDAELQAMVAWLMPFPCVVVWVLFNEGWGQSRTAARVAWLRQADPWRLIDAASGWNELASSPKLGDFADVHNYEGKSSAFGPLPQTFTRWPFQLGPRVRVLGEYGGLGYAVPGHEWTPGVGAWGYGGRVHRDAQAYQAALEELFDRLLPLLCGGGLGAAIYTQWTDVESETNGLLTYDRHAKLPIEVFRAYSQGLLSAWRQCSEAAARAAVR